jgi:hypothetical protein
MAGRYQGCHLIRDKNGLECGRFDVFWQQDGWYWRPSDGQAIGPFTTSTQAYQNASAYFAHSPRFRNIPGAGVAKRLEGS